MLVAHNSFMHAYTELGFVGGTFFFGAYYYVLTSLAQLGSTPPMIRDPEVRYVRPYIMAAVVSVAVSQMSLSQCYAVATYAMLGVGAVCVRLADAEPSRRVPAAQASRVSTRPGFPDLPGCDQYSGQVDAEVVMLAKHNRGSAMVIPSKEAAAPGSSVNVQATRSIESATTNKSKRLMTTRIGNNSVGNKPLKALLVDGTAVYGGAFEIAFNLVKHANQIEPQAVGLVSSQPSDYLNARIADDFASYYFPVKRWKPAGGTASIWLGLRPRICSNASYRLHTGSRVSSGISGLQSSI